MKHLRQFVGGLAVLALFYPLVLYCGQKHLYLFPDLKYVSPKEKHLPYFIEKTFVSSDGLPIMGWYAKGDINKPAILFFHGNSGQIAFFAPKMKKYISRGYSVFMSEYRGFGGTLGEFTQDTLYMDALAAYDFLNKELKQSKIIVFGYSMGTAPASFVAANRPTLGLVLAAPFYSLKKVAGEQHIPLARFLLKYELPSYRYIKASGAPLIIVHGESDTLIFFEHSKDLYAISEAIDKEFHLIKQYSHNDLFFKNKAHQMILNWLNEKFPN